jgi:PucR C-terminal helix-turn-helix domain/Purine catabolism regulatory protein-like family
VQLRDILQQQNLQLVDIEPDDHVLDRQVSGVNTTDLPDPSRYLSGGDIVLSGLMWYSGPDSAERFVAALAQAGVAALGAGEAALGGVPEDLVTACARHGVPLFKVPVEVSFTSILNATSPTMWSERAAGLSTVLSRHRTMISALAAGKHLTDLLPGIAAQLGLECWVLTITGRLRAGTSTLSANDVLAVMSAFHRASQLPVNIGEPHLLVHRAGGSVAQRLDAWCVASRGGTAEAVEELVSLVELERASLDERLQVERRLTAQLLGAVRWGTDTSTIRAHMTSCGLAADAAFLVVAMALSPAPATVALGVLSEICQTTAAIHDGLAVAVVPSSTDPAVQVAEMRKALATVEPGLRGGRLAIGVSSVGTSADAMADALDQAVNMARLAASQSKSAWMVANDEVTTHRLLLACIPAQTRQIFHDRLLGPLLAYDRQRKTELVPTLRAFLDASGSWEKCATQLHIHVNTLRHRLKRVEQITGRDVNQFDDRVDLYLALRMGH